MGTRRIPTAIISAAVGLGAFTPIANATYPEKNIDVIIPYRPGGGFDVYARAVARVMEKKLGNGINIVPRNVPGAAAIKGLTLLYRAPADGYTFGIVPLPGGVQPKLLGQKVDYDLDKVTWLGVVNIGVYSLAIGKQAPFKTLKDFLAAQPRVPFFATTGSNDYAMAKIVMGTLNGKASYLTSFQGAPAAHLAVVRGEADATLGIDVTIARHLKTGDMRELVWFQRKGTRGAPKGVPTADDIGHPDLANIGLYRMFAAPPGLPADVRAKLTGALQATLKDAEFIAWSEKAKFPIDPGTPEMAKKLYEEQKIFLSKHVELLKPAPKADKGNKK